MFRLKFIFIWRLCNGSPIYNGFGRLTKNDYEVIDWAIEVTGTEEFKYRPVDALSGGQR